jgi:hypothetical protein
VSAVSRTTGAMTAAGPRSLHAICELTRLAACGHCGAGTLTRPCVSSSTGPDGLHIARFAAARRRGLITSTDFAAVVEAAGVFTNATIVYDETLGGGRP